MFQSTLPRGERPFRVFRGQSRAFVSIHAPARGATPLITGLISEIQFQSTLPRGERPEVPDRKFVVFRFQSTLPRGERPHPGRHR